MQIHGLPIPKGWKAELAQKNLSDSRFRQSLKTLLFGQWDQDAM